MPRCLDPIVDEHSSVLILGSMPSRQSLKEGKYYAYKFNKFWPILFALFGEEFSVDYETRKSLVRRKGIALWETLAFCQRDNSSLDSKIKNAAPNDIAGLLKKYPNIKHVVTNGRTSEKYFVKFNGEIEHIYLPSTSPANASVKNVEEAWSETLKTLLQIP